MALMGFLDNFLPERIQILAQTELTYLATLAPQQVRHAIDRLFQFEIPCIVVCKGLEVPPYLMDNIARYLRANGGHNMRTLLFTGLTKLGIQVEQEDLVPQRQRRSR